MEMIDLTTLLNEKDNNITIVAEDGLPQGFILESFGITLIEAVPYGQKVAIGDIDENMPIIRYGEIIAYAKQWISKGEVIDSTKIYIKPVNDLDINIPYESRKRNLKGINLKDKYFLGYENEDGTVATRNILAISTTVQCSEGFINVLIDRIRQELLVKYANVDDVVMISHLYGCGVAIDGDGAHIPQRTIANILDNPNFGGQVLMICLGCEKFTYDMVHGVNEADVIMQQDGSFEEMMEKSLKLAEEKLKILNERVRTPQPLSKLRLGLQCGGSDALSGMTANSVFGYVADILVDAGASVIFSEVTEIRDAANILISRMSDEDVRKKFIQEMKWYDNYLNQAHVDRSANPSPGNKKGGLVSVIDKAMGSVAKSGSSDIIDVLSPGEKIKKSGLTFAATPASDFVCGTQQLASGINMMLFSTGRGTSYNLRQVPVLKVATNNGLAKRWNDLIDFNAGEIVIGQATVEDLAIKLLDLIIECASGRYETKADKLKLYNQLAVFNPAPIT